MDPLSANGGFFDFAECTYQALPSFAVCDRVPVAHLICSSMDMIIDLEAGGCFHQPRRTGTSIGFGK